jgi:hypothetical protein
MKHFLGLALATVVMLNSNLHGAITIPNPTVTTPVTGGSRGQAFGGLAAADLPTGYLDGAAVRRCPVRPTEEV